MAHHTTVTNNLEDPVFIATPLFGVDPIGAGILYTVVPGETWGPVGAKWSWMQFNTTADRFSLDVSVEYLAEGTSAELTFRRPDV